MAEHTTANENSNPAILDLPVTSYDIIFAFLDVADLRSCRTVCTKWCTLTTKSYRKYTGHFIEGRRRGCRWSNKRILKENVEKFLKMKKYEDPQAPVLKLMLKDVDIAVLNKMLPQTPDFKGTMDNITHLWLSHVIFENCEILVEFVSQFTNLQHLSMDHSHRSTSRNDFSTSLKLNCFKGIDKPGKVFPPKLNSLHLVIRDDCYNLQDLISVFVLRIKTITELRLTVIPTRRFSFTQWTIIDRWVALSNALMMEELRKVGHITFFLAKMIEKHSKTMKCLHINWGTNKDRMLDNLLFLDSISLYQNLLVTHHVQMCMMLKKVGDFPDLALTDFALNLQAADELLSCVISLHVIPFLNKQVNKGLRRIFLGRIQWSLDVYKSQIFPNFLYYWGQEDLQVFNELLLTCSCSENVLLTTKKSYARYIRSTILFSSLLITDVVFTITTRYPSSTQEDDGLPPVEKFAEWMPPCVTVENPSGAPFRQLTSLQIYCEDNKINSFSIPTICTWCPALTVLKIVDGHGIGVTKPKSFYQNYEEMSCSGISDCDFLFIFAKLKELQSLTLWGNLSRLSDFGIIGDRLLEKGETNSAQQYLNFKEELATVLQQEIRLDENSNEYAETQLCIQSSTNQLQDLNFLSLRGVGKNLTDAIAAPTSRLCQLPKVKTLEIVGSHNITVQGKKALNQFITTVQIEVERRGKSILIPVNRFW